MSWETDTIEPATVKAHGQTFEKETGTDFVDAVREVANELGINKFDVKLNGEFVEPAEAPNELSSGDTVVIEPTKGAR